MNLRPTYRILKSKPPASLSLRPTLMPRPSPMKKESDRIVRRFNKKPCRKKRKKCGKKKCNCK